MWHNNVTYDYSSPPPLPHLSPRCTELLLIKNYGKAAVYKISRKYSEMNKLSKVHWAMCIVYATAYNAKMKLQNNILIERNCHIYVISNLFVISKFSIFVHIDRCDINYYYIPRHYWMTIIACVFLHLQVYAFVCPPRFLEYRHVCLVWTAQAIVNALEFHFVRIEWIIVTVYYIDRLGC